jgi:hypothetical protein
MGKCDYECGYEVSLPSIWSCGGFCQNRVPQVPFKLATALDRATALNTIFQPLQIPKRIWHKTIQNGDTKGPRPCWALNRHLPTTKQFDKVWPCYPLSTARHRMPNIGGAWLQLCGQTEPGKPGEPGEPSEMGSLFVPEKKMESKGTLPQFHWLRSWFSHYLMAVVFAPIVWFVWTNGAREHLVKPRRTGRFTIKYDHWCPFSNALDCFGT